VRPLVLIEPPTETAASYAARTAAPESFRACVEWRESRNGVAPNLYGFLGPTWASLGRDGAPAAASAAEQRAAFEQLYAEQGAAPWRPYDGC
jgi:hypothetical protein